MCSIKDHRRMDNKLKKIADNHSNADAKTTAPDDDVETYFQLKKMKKWLGVNHTTNVYDDEGGPLSYGDGHSGWNR